MKGCANQLNEHIKSFGLEGDKNGVEKLNPFEVDERLKKWNISFMLAEYHDVHENTTSTVHTHPCLFSIKDIVLEETASPFFLSEKYCALYVEGASRAVYKGPESSVEEQKLADDTLAEYNRLHAGAEAFSDKALEQNGGDETLANKVQLTGNDLFFQYFPAGKYIRNIEMWADGAQKAVVEKRTRVYKIAVTGDSKFKNKFDQTNKIVPSADLEGLPDAAKEACKSEFDTLADQIAASSIRELDGPEDITSNLDQEFNIKSTEHIYIIRHLNTHYIMVPSTMTPENKEKAPTKSIRKLLLDIICANFQVQY